jgi:hypothetical protein
LCNFEIIYGCTDTAAFNFNPNATNDDDSCTEILEGCTDEFAFNYDSLANTFDNSCTYLGCSDSLALNFYGASIDDGSCIYDLSTLSVGLTLKGILDLNGSGSDIYSGYDGKAIHLVANEDIPDLSIYSLGVANNGGGTDGPEYNLSGSASTGDNILVYRVGTGTNSESFFSDYFGDCFSEFDVLIHTGTSFPDGNGDDPVELFENGVVIDFYGDVDGSAISGDPYEDGWTYKQEDGTWLDGGEDCDVESPEGYSVVSSGCPYPLCPEPAVPLQITTSVCPGATSVRLTGPWWSWDPNGGPEAVDNGDDTWTFTFDPAPDADMEYLLVVDGVQENMLEAPHPDLDGDGYGDLWDCTPLTDYYSYANRQWVVGSGDVTNSYGTCGELECSDPCLTLNLIDSYGDGWNGGSLSINGVDYELPDGNEGSFDLCDVDLMTCTLIDYSPGSYSYENSWSVTNSLGDVLASGGDNSGTLGECPAFVNFTVNMNNVDQPSPEYDNVVVNGSWNGWNGWGVQLSDDDTDGVWTGTLEVDPGTSFEYVVAVTGSADGWSGWGLQWGDGFDNNNVSVDAGEAGSTVETSLTAQNPCSGEVVTLTLSDSYGDTWNGGLLTVNGVDYDNPSTGSSWSGGASDSYPICLDLSTCTDLLYTSGSYSYENSWEVTNANGEVLASGGDESGQVGACTPGCMDPEALNYNDLAVIDDSSCFYPPPCSSINFQFENTGSNMTLFITEGSTSFGHPLSEGDLIGAFYTDDDGDLQCAGASPWTGGALQIAVMGTESLELDNGFVEGEELTIMAQTSSGIYDVVPVYQSGSGVYTLNGISIASSISFTINCAGQLEGCLDGHYFEYNPEATLHVPEMCQNLTVFGCIDDSFAEFNPLANVDDGSCATLSGCMDPTYVEFNELAEVDTDPTSCLTQVPGCTASNADNFNSEATIDDGSCLFSGCTDNFYSEFDPQANVDDGSCSVTWQSYALDLSSQLADAISNQDDGISQADVDAASDAAQLACIEITNAMQLELDAANAIISELQSSDGYCPEILIDLILGWNMIGYTLPHEQDAAATFSSIDEHILIVKNNAAEVYWPEFGFNGIGNLIPGQGYQLKITTSIDDYTYPDVGDQRVDLFETVPSWAIDMEALIHPNDVRSLVRVVNMLGQEVDVRNQFKGEVLLYLYNDGTVEKRIVE